MRYQTSDLWIPRSDALTAEPQRLHMTRVLRTARITNVESVMFVDRNERDGK